MRRVYNQKAISLVELTLAMVLFGIVMLTGISMELSMRRILSSADAEGQLLGEASPIMAMVGKDINRGIGISGDPAYQYAASGADKNYSIRVDQNFNGKADAPDRFVRYRFRGDLTPGELWFYRDATSSVYDVLSNRTTSFDISAPVNGISTFVLTLRQNPTAAVNATNPEITLNSTAEYRESSYH